MHELLLWGIAQANLHLGACDIVGKCTCRYAVNGLCALKGDKTACDILPVAQCYVKREVVLELLFVCQFGFAHIANLVVILSFETDEEVVLVCVEIVLAILVYVVLITQSQ